MTDWGWLTLLASGVSVAMSSTATLHVLLTKEEPRSAIGWIGIVWLSPFLGTILYAVFGVNRIQRKARIMKRMRPGSSMPFEPGGEHEAELDSAILTSDRPQLRQLARLIGEVTDQPLLEGNAVNPLIGGDYAYARMLDAIRGAQFSIGLVSYIFRDDRIGSRFVQALRQAMDRGVEVRVLIDDLGARHGGRSAIRSLRKAGVPTTRFIPAFAPFWLRYLNLRNHRKILVVDGKIGFTGGLNIDESFLWEVNPKVRKQDIHFEIHGPAVASFPSQRR